MALLRSPLHRLLSGSVLLIAYTGRRSGRTFRRPVMYAMHGPDELVIVVGNAEQKVWWRNLASAAPVRVRLRGAVRDGTGQVVRGDPELRAAWAARFPRAARRVPQDPVMVRVRLG